jgi:aspartate aminotransferase
MRGGDNSGIENQPGNHPMLDRLSAVPPDPILGIISAHAADPNPNKIDLGIGVYKDENGDTPILECVRRAEQILDSTQTDPG